MKFFLAREGVAFGPYTELQVRESVRLGIFVLDDLALAEDGTEWFTVAELLPTRETPLPKPSPETPPPAEPISLASNLTHRFDSVWNIPTLRRGLAFAVILLVTVFSFLGGWAFRRSPSTPQNGIDSAASAHRQPLTDSPTRMPVQSVPTTLPEKAELPVSSHNVAATYADPTLSSSQEAMTTMPVELAKPTPEQSTAQEVPQRQIEGQIYISARNGLKYEPSSVEVRLYPLSQLKPYLEKRGSEANARYESLKAKIKVAEAEKERLRKIADNTFDAYVRSATGAPDRRSLEQAIAETKKAREKAANAYYNLLQEREDSLSGAFYLEELPKSVDVTRTDNQGRFTFQVSDDGEFAVVAGAQRGRDSSIERYYWFVPVNLDGEPKKTVLLSNNNISSHGSADSLVQTVD